MCIPLVDTWLAQLHCLKLGAHEQVYNLSYCASFIMPNGRQFLQKSECDSLIRHETWEWEKADSIVVFKKFSFFWIVRKPSHVSRNSLLSNMKWIIIIRLINLSTEGKFIHSFLCFHLGYFLYAVSLVTETHILRSSILSKDLWITCKHSKFQALDDYDVITLMSSSSTFQTDC